MKNFIIISIFVGFLASCSTSTDNKNQIHFTNVVNRNSSSEIFCCELKENLGYIDKSINNFSIISDSVFIVTNKKKIYMYDLRGNQTKEIGGYGKGPSEYISANQLYISDNYIYVWCEALLKLIVYKKDGSYIKEFKGFDFAIQKFVVLNDNTVYFYIPGNEKNLSYIKIYDLVNKTYITEFGKISESDKLLFMNNGGGLCVSNHDVLYTSASQLSVFSVNENKESLAFEIDDSDFKVEVIDNAQLIANNNFKNVINYIHNNSIVVNIFAYNNYIYLMSEIGKLTINEGERNVDFSNRKIAIYKVDSNFNPLRKTKYDYPKNLLKYSFYKNFIYFISFDEESSSFVLKKINLDE